MEQDMETQLSLQDGWQAKLNQDGRLYYLDHNTKTSHWLPPPTSWSDKADLPYGWEGAMDKNGKQYYINHVTFGTTREDPFEIEDVPPVEREVQLTRDPSLGFGFIAGSEKPVVIRSVTDGGPSVGKLLPGDKILKINGEDVLKKEGQFIIERIRQSNELIRLTVIQPYIDKSGLKSSFLSAIKKQKLKAKPNRVRFSDNESIATISPNNTKVPPSLVYLPNVLKVYLENGQTKSFKYDNKTTVKDVLHNIQEKLGIKCMEYFSLGVHDIRNPTNQQLTILQDDELVRQTASRPGSQHLKCLLRVTFVPKDAYDLLSRDPTAFDYFYLQCCNDVTSGRFGDDLKFDMAVKLAALHIHQHVLCNKQKAKVSIKAVQKDDGLERFLPKSIIEKYKTKELKKVVGQHIKQNQNLTAPGQKHLTELQAKLHYLKVISGLVSFGGKVYSGTLLGESEGNLGTAMTVLVGPKVSISRVTDTKAKTLTPLVNFSELSRLKLSRKGPICDDVYKLEMCRRESKPLVFLLHTEDAQDMASLINGYYRLFEDPNHSLLPDEETKSFLMNTEAPPYRGKHRVIATGWNYPSDLVSENVAMDNNDAEPTGMQDGEHIVDLTSGPPAYVYDAAFISKLKEEKKFRSKESLDNIDGAQSLESESESETEEPLNRNINNSFLSNSSAESGTTRNGSLVDLSTLTDLVDSMFNMAPEKSEDDDNIRHSFSSKTEKKSNEKKRFSFSDAVRPKKGPFSSTKYNVSDSLATNDDIQEGGIKLLNYSSFHGDAMNHDRDGESSDSDGGDFIDSAPRRKKGGNNSKAAQIKSRDSIYLIRTKVNYSGRNSPIPQEFSSDAEEDIREDEEASHEVSSPGVTDSSDIIDLTHDASVADIDISIDADSSDFNLGVVDELEDLTTSSPKRDSESLDLSIELKEQTEKRVDVEEEELPVSVIDLPSPDSEEDQQLSDQAHGIQMSAIDALNASIVVDRTINQAARPTECESDSGNETISSETIENPIDQVGFSHSPNDYFQILGTDKQPVSPKRESSPDEAASSTNSSTLDGSILVESLPDNSDSNILNQSDSHTPIESIHDTTHESAIPDDITDNQTKSSLNESSNNSISDTPEKIASQSIETSENDSVHDISVTSEINRSIVGNENEDKQDVTGSSMSDQDLDALFALDSTQNSSILDAAGNDDGDVEMVIELEEEEVEEGEESEEVESNIVESDELKLDTQEDVQISDHTVDNVIKDDVEINKMETDDLRHTPTSSLSMTHGSDTDSCTSTLRGSMSNLTSLESTEELNECLAEDGNLEIGDEEGKSAIDDLILSLMVAPPPSVAAVDEELLGIIIPPPPVDDFDFGTIEDIVTRTDDDSDEIFTGDVISTPSVDAKIENKVVSTDSDITAHDQINLKEDVTQTDHEIRDTIEPVENKTDEQCPVEEPVSLNEEISDTEPSLTKDDDTLEIQPKLEENTAQINKMNLLSVQNKQEDGSSPRGFRSTAGSVGASLDSGFHQPDSVELDGSSCCNSLQESQFITEKAGIDSDSTTIKSEKGLSQDVKESPRLPSLVVNMKISEDGTSSPITFTTAATLDKTPPPSLELDGEKSLHITSSEPDDKTPFPSLELDGEKSLHITSLEPNDTNDCLNVTTKLELDKPDDEVCNDGLTHDKVVNGDSTNDVLEAVNLLDAATTCLDNVSLASTISSADSCSSKDSTHTDVMIRPRLTRPKPAVPPKPAIKPDILARRQSIDMGGLNRQRKGSAPKPPKLPITTEASNSILQRSVSMQVFTDDDGKSANPALTRPSSLTSVSSRHPFVRSEAIDASQTDKTELLEKERSPVRRSNTIASATAEKESGVLYPARKAPPPPMPKPKPKIRMGVSGTWAARGSNSPGTTNPPSIRKLLSPSRTKPWTRGPIPFARNKDTPPEPEVKSQTKEKKPSLPQKMFYSWTRKEASKAKHSMGRSDSNRGKVDPPSLREVMGLKRPSVLDLAERMQQASQANAPPQMSDPVTRSLQSPRTLPRTSVIYVPPSSSQSPRMSHTLPNQPGFMRSYSADQSPDTTPVPLRSNSISMEYPVRTSPRERPKSMPNSLPGSPRHIELPKRPPPPRPKAPPRTNSMSSISTLVSDCSDTESISSFRDDASSIFDSPPGTPPTPKAQRRNSFSGSISSDSSGTRTPPTPRAIRRNVPDSLSTPSPDDDVFDVTSPLPLPSPVPTEMDLSINSELTSPPPLPTSAPPLPSSVPPSSSSTRAESPVSNSLTRTSPEPPVEDDDVDTTISTNLTLEIEFKDYDGNDSIVDAANDIPIILSELGESMDKLKESTPSIAQFRQCKQTMLAESREFTSNTKMFVSSAGQSAEHLVSCLNSSMHTLARLCTATQQFIKAIPSLNQAKNLGNKVKEIVSNFRSTIQVAAEAHGMPLQHPKMQQLLRQAQTMAILLSALMRSLRILHC